MAELIYNQEYKLYRDNEFIGIATWTEDINIGDSFQSNSIDESGQLINEVYIADTWEKVNNN